MWAAPCLEHFPVQVMNQYSLTLCVTIMHRQYTDQEFLERCIVRPKTYIPNSRKSYSNSSSNRDCWCLQPQDFQHQLTSAVSKSKYETDLECIWLQSQDFHQAHAISTHTHVWQCISLDTFGPMTSDDKRNASHDFRLCPGAIPRLRLES